MYLLFGYFLKLNDGLMSLGYYKYDVSYYFVKYQYLFFDFIMIFVIYFYYLIYYQDIDFCILECSSFFLVNLYYSLIFG